MWNHLLNHEYRGQCVEKTIKEKLFMTMRVFNHDVSNGVPKMHTLTRLSQAEVNKLITWLSQAVMAQTGHLSITVTR